MSPHTGAMSARKFRGNGLGNRMVYVVGHIALLMIDQEFADEEGIPATSAEVEVSILRHLEGKFANIVPVVQNGVTAIALFDFSNHASQQRRAFEECNAYLEDLRSRGFPVNWSFEFRDEEKEDYWMSQSQQRW